MTVSGCPVCQLSDGFHDRGKHAGHEVPGDLIKVKDWLKLCPLCVTCGAGDLCPEHVVFMEQLDEIIDENQEVLGRLSDQDRLDFGVSLQQMRRGEGRVVISRALRRDPDKIRGVDHPDEGDGLAWVRGEGDDEGGEGEVAPAPEA